MMVKKKLEPPENFEENIVRLMRKLKILQRIRNVQLRDRITPIEKFFSFQIPIRLHVNLIVKNKTIEKNKTCTHKTATKNMSLAHYKTERQYVWEYLELF